MKQILQSLSFYYSIIRGLGHTKTLLNGLKNNPDALLITHTKKYGEEIKKQNNLTNKVLSLNEIESLLGGHNQPLYLDNEALREIFEKSHDEILSLEKSLYEERQKNFTLADNLRFIVEENIILRKYNDDLNVKNKQLLIEEIFHKDDKHIYYVYIYIVLIIILYLSIFINIKLN